MIYLQSVDYNLWEAVVNGPQVPTNTIDVRTIEKPPKGGMEMIRSDYQ